jgi:PKD repeat protein
MRASVTVAVATLCAAASFAACTVHKTEAPALAGPSEFALSLAITATPDSINQDGSSQSSVRVSAKGPDGRPISGLPLRVDMQVHGLLQDFGTLSARSIVTGTDGVAQTVYTAPPKAVGGNTETCGEAPGTCVDIVATPTGTNSQGANSQTATIRLVPPGVILPPAGSPTADFTFAPSSPSLNVPVTFDASTSQPGQNAEISNYSWTFGDGQTGSDKVVNHAFSSTGKFTVTLTVTNDRGLSASKPLDVIVSAPQPPSGDWLNSPIKPVVNETVFFNAAGVQVSAGRTVTRYDWSFGDGATASGQMTTHVFTAANTYAVVLTVTDDVGQTSVLPHNLTIDTANPTAKLTLTKAGGLSVVADGSLSTAVGSAVITKYTFDFGPRFGSQSQSGPVLPFSFPELGTYTVTLIVTDNLGRSSAAFAATITVP